MAQNDEYITRQAAKAIGLTIPPSAKFDERLRGLVFFPACPTRQATFAPITLPADAYLIEDTLRLNVRYKAHQRTADGAILMGILVGTDDAGAVHHAVPEGQDSMTARMYAVVQYAALHAMMECEAVDG